MCSAKFLGSLQCLRSPTGNGEMGVVFHGFSPLCQGNWKVGVTVQNAAGLVRLFCIKNNMVSNIRWHPFTEVWRQISPSSTAGNRKACFLGPGSQIFHDASTALALIYFLTMFSWWQINMQTRKARHLCTRILLNAQGLLGWSSIAAQIAERVFWLRIVPQWRISVTHEGQIWRIFLSSPHRRRSDLNGQYLMDLVSMEDSPLPRSSQK